MVLGFKDQFGGGQQEVELGRSRIQPRETYSANPIAIQNMYRDQMSRTNELVESLSKFGNAVGKVEEQQRKAELEQAEVTANQIFGQLTGDQNVTEQIAQLTPDRSPLFRAAVSEAIARKHAESESFKIIETMPPEVRGNPELSDKWFQERLTAESQRVGGQNFYGSTYVKTMSDLFRKRSASLSTERTKDMQGIFDEDHRDRLARAGIEAISTTATNAVPQNVRSILDFVSRPESGGNYNAYLGNAKNQNIKLTEMTISEVMKFQNDLVRRGAESGAAGRYQIIGKTLKGLVQRLGIDPNTTKFTPEVQDKMGFELLKVRGFDRWKNGTISDTEFANSLAKEWAGLPVVSGANAGRSFYAGVGSNRAGVGVQEFLGAIQTSKQISGDSQQPSAPVQTTSLTPQPVPSDFNTLRPDVQAARERFMGEDQRYVTIGGNSPIVRQQSRANMVEASITMAKEANDGFGDVEFLKIVPPEILLPAQRERLMKAAEAITTNQRQLVTFQQAQAKKEREEAKLRTESFLNGKIMRGEPLSVDERLQINGLFPDLITGYDSRRSSVAPGMRASPESDSVNAARFRREMDQAHALGKDPLDFLMENKAVHQSFIGSSEFDAIIKHAESLTKVKGELYHEAYKDMTNAFLNTNYGVSGFTTINPKQNPEAQKAYDFLRTRLIYHIGDYIDANGRLVGSDETGRTRIFRKASEEVLARYPATGLGQSQAGRPVTSSQNRSSVPANVENTARRLFQ
jgi:hypothetical protein